MFAADEGAPSRARHKSLIETVRKLGLAANLKLALDAGDILSYPGSGTKWLDTSGLGHDFDFGATTKSPAFNGVAGQRSAAEFMSYDGGDVFNYDSANETWMNNLHKDNALWSFVAWLRIGALGAAQRIFGTSSASNSQAGIDVAFGATNLLTISFRNASGTSGLNAASTLAAVAGDWAFFAGSVNEAIGAGGILYRKDATTDTDAATITSPSAANAGFTMQLGAAGNDITPLSNGSRMAMFGMWEGAALSDNSLKAIFNGTRRRFGV
jgi:hypothetical protein